jgi:hypothetical protein
MSEELLIRHCSPTLAGLKTANLFNCGYKTEEELKEYLHLINIKLSDKGVRVMPLKYSDNKALIYLFRPEKLEEDLADEEALKLLKDAGYEAECCLGYGGQGTQCAGKYCPGLGKCLAHLMDRLRTSQSFPHEIGLFLGYPPEDVKGFLDKDNKKCKCVGAWKVFGDGEKAKKKFAQYKKCNSVYSRLYAEGRPVEKLTVSVK